MTFWDRLKRWYQEKFLHYAICPSCGKWTGWDFHKIVIVFEEEPPMFAEWICKACGWTTGAFPTSITETSVKQLGYRDFDDYADKNDLRGS